MGDAEAARVEQHARYDDDHDGYTEAVTGSGELIMSINIAISPLRLVQGAAGIAAATGGYAIASGMVRSAFREDHLGDPQRILEVTKNGMLYQEREPKGPSLSRNLLLGAAIPGFIGGGLMAGPAAAATGAKALALNGGAAALLALGVGLAAGAVAASPQWSRAEFART